MISVLINNYNYGRFLSEAIESVLSQTYGDWELIIVDDGSQDDSWDVIRSFSERYPDRIKSICKENGGQASCFNAGFAASSGDVIAFLDSDDYWFPTKLEVIAKAHENHEYVAHGKKFSDESFYRADTVQNDKRSGYLRKYGVFDSYNLTTSVVSFSRKLLEKILPMPEEGYRVCADHYVKMAALYYTNIYYIPEELTYYRIHGSNAYASLDIQGRAQSHDEELDFMSVEYFNERLLAENDKAELIPHRCLRLTEEFYKEIGNGFQIEKDKKYVVFGTGNDSRTMIRYITQKEGQIVAFCDSSAEKKGKRFFAKEIWSPEMLIKKREEYDRIVLGSLRYYKEMIDRLEAMGLKMGMDYIYTPAY